MRLQQRLIVALALVFAGLMLHSFFDRGPKFQGKAAKYWANELIRGNPSRESVAAQALLELGPEVAVPVLTQALESKGPPLYRDLWPKLPKALRTRLPNPLTDSENQYRAVLVLGEFGPAAKPAVPQLTAALRHSTPEGQCAAAAALGKIGAEARPAISALEAMARDTNSNPFTSQAAVAALKQISGGHTAIAPPLP